MYVCMYVYENPSSPLPGGSEYPIFDASALFIRSMDLGASMDSVTKDLFRKGLGLHAAPVFQLFGYGIHPTSWSFMWLPPRCHDLDK